MTTKAAAVTDAPMSLDEAIAAASKKPRGGDVDDLLQELPDDQSARVLELLHDREWSSQRIEDMLLLTGRKVGRNAIDGWRKRNGAR